MAASGCLGENRHAVKDAVGKGVGDRGRFGAAPLGEEADVFASDLQLVVYLVKGPDPVIAIAPAEAAQQKPVADAPGN